MTRSVRIGLTLLVLATISSMTGCRSFARGFGQGLGSSIGGGHRRETVVVYERPVYRPAPVVVVHRGGRYCR